MDIAAPTRETNYITLRLFRHVRHRFVATRTREDSMSTSKTGIGGKSRPVALGLFAISFLAFLFVLASGAWSPAQATGPALWMASAQQTVPPLPGDTGGVVQVRPHQLITSHVPRFIKIGSQVEPLANSGGLAFQPNGNLWITTFTLQTNGGNAILKFTPTQLTNLSTGVHPHPKPAAMITSPSFGLILGAVFDAHVNLWVVDAMNGAIYEISHAQLVAATAAGTPITPAVTITDPTDLSQPAFATFDAAGDLWVSSEANSKIVEFTPSQLATGGTQTPKLVLISDSNSINEPGQLQFDSTGRLWVANSGAATAVAFAPATLSMSGTAVPAPAAVTLTLGTTTTFIPWGLQFDSTNHLWVFDYINGTVVKFGPGQLLASGTPTPRITLSGLPLYCSQLTFGPAH
jgi:sugar lactone lactonase YvrE